MSGHTLCDTFFAPTNHVSTRFALRRNKLEMLTLATEHRQTLELTPVPIKPTKPFFFSKVASYAADDLE